MSTKDVTDYCGECGAAVAPNDAHRLEWRGRELVFCEPCWQAGKCPQCADGRKSQLFVDDVGNLCCDCDSRAATEAHLADLAARRACGMSAQSYDDGGWDDLL